MILRGNSLQNERNPCKKVLQNRFVLMNRLSDSNCCVIRNHMNCDGLGSPSILVCSWGPFAGCRKLFFRAFIEITFDPQGQLRWQNYRPRKLIKIRFQSVLETTRDTLVCVESSPTFHFRFRALVHNICHTVSIASRKSHFIESLHVVFGFGNIIIENIIFFSSWGEPEKVSR